MVQGRDRRVELGYQLALECRKMIGMYPLKNKNSKFNPPPPGMTADGQPIPETGSNDTASQPVAVTSSAWKGLNIWAFGIIVVTYVFSNETISKERNLIVNRFNMTPLKYFEKGN